MHESAQHNELRYRRQVAEIGESGQKQINAARVLIVGAGGLGCTVGLYLAGAGIGIIGISDDDIVTLDNLHRQIIYREIDVGKEKTKVVVTQLQQRNASIVVRCHRAFTSTTQEMLEQYSLVIDCSDNAATRYALYDSCIESNKPLVYASVSKRSGYVALFGKSHGCLRCLFPDESEGYSCSSDGILGPVVGVAASLQANMAIRWLIGEPQPCNTLLRFDLATQQFISASYQRRLSCICQQTPTTAVVTTPLLPSITAMELTQYLAAASDIQVIDIRQRGDFDVQHIAGANHVPIQQVAAIVGQRCTEKVVVVCETGARARSVVRSLQAQNVVKSMVLTGGMAAWQQFSKC